MLQQASQPLHRMTEEGHAPIPPQYTLGAAPAADFRRAALGPVGMSKKRKMEYQDRVMIFTIDAFCSS